MLSSKLFGKSKLCHIKHIFKKQKYFDKTVGNKSENYCETKI